MKKLREKAGMGSESTDVETSTDTVGRTYLGFFVVLGVTVLSVSMLDTWFPLVLDDGNIGQGLTLGVAWFLLLFVQQVFSGSSRRVIGWLSNWKMSVIRSFVGLSYWMTLVAGRPVSDDPLLFETEFVLLLGVGCVGLIYLEINERLD